MNARLFNYIFDIQNRRRERLVAIQDELAAANNYKYRGAKQLEQHLMILQDNMETDMLLLRHFA